MGLDIVELIMRAEEEFEIEIGDEEAEQCATVGQLTHLVMLKLGISPSQGCASSAAFYQTRRDLMAITGISRREIRPQTPMQQVFEVRNRRQMWQRFSAQSGVHLPDLMLPEWLNSAIFSGFVMLCVAGFIAFLSSETLIGAACWFSGIGYLTLAFALARPWQRRFPASCQTVGAVSHLALISQFKASPEMLVSDHQNEIWRRVQFLISDEMGVPLEKITPDADFVRDLGLG